MNWDSFKWRNHQPDIGRFFNIDPISEDYYYNSPYAFSENKVTSHIELEGLESRRSISAEEINGQWTMASDNHISLEAEAKQKLDALATQNRVDSSTPKQVKELVSMLETVSTLSGLDTAPIEESKLPPMSLPLAGRSKMMGAGPVVLSAINVALGAKDLTLQANEEGLANVNKLDAAQLTVGAVGGGRKWFRMGWHWWYCS